MKAIYKTKGKANEYCELAVNIYDGCTNGCTYCFAPDVKDKDRETFYDCASVRDGIVEAVREQMRSGAYAGKTIQLCFTCDPYPTGVDTSATRAVIKAIKEGDGNVQILTKNPSAVERDYDLLDENDLIGATISGAGKDIEPNSESTEERLAALRKAKDALGCEVWVSCEPVFDEDVVYGILENIDWIDTYKVGKTNYVECDIDWKAFGEKVAELGERFGRTVLIKEGLREEMER